MNKLIILAFCWFFAIEPSCAQNRFDWDFHIKDDIGVGLVSIHGNYYCVSNGEGRTYEERARIHSWDKKGKLRFSIPFTGFNLAVNQQAISTSDQKIVAVGIDHGCDYMWHRRFIAKFDTNGALLFRSIFFAGSVYPLSPLLNVVERSNGHFFVTYGDSAYFFDENGQKYQDNSPSISNYYAGKNLDGNRLLYSALYNGDNKLVKISSSGFVTTEVTAPPASKILETNAGNFLCLSGSTLHLYDSTLSFVSLFTASFTPADVEIQNDTIYMIGAEHQYLVMDVDFNQIHAVSKPEGGSVAGDLVVNGAEVAFISNFGGVKTVHGEVAKHFGVTAFPKLNDWHYSPDIGVIDFSNSFSFLKANKYETYKQIDASFEMQFVVKNFGTDTVFNFYVNADLTSGYPQYCNKPYFHAKYSGYLLPGKTLTFNTGRYDVLWYRYVPNELQTSELEIDSIRFWTSAPNGKIDANTQNDVFKKNMVFPIMTGMAELNGELEVTVSPNPCTDKVLIKTNQEIARSELFDIQGRSVLQTSSFLNEISLDLSEVAAGLYFLQLEGDNRKYFRKIVKE